MDTVLKVENLTKKFGKVAAVKGISFEISRGQIFGLLGPNGSGKSTTLNIILTFLKPTAGSVSLFGSNDLSGQLSRVGALLESASYYPDLSVERNLRISCKIKNASPERIDEVLQTIGLVEARDRKAKNLSLGMKQRLAIGAALLNDPELMIFDEPTNGLDPIGIVEIRELIKSIAQQGKTVLIASHLLNEMERFCTHVAILKNGEIKETGAMLELMNGYTSLEDFFLAKTR